MYDRFQSLYKILKKGDKKELEEYCMQYQNLPKDILASYPKSYNTLNEIKQKINKLQIENHNLKEKLYDLKLAHSSDFMDSHLQLLHEEIGSLENENKTIEHKISSDSFNNLFIGKKNFSAPNETLEEKEDQAIESSPKWIYDCLLYTSPSPRDGLLSRMPSSA